MNKTFKTALPYIVYLLLSILMIGFFQGRSLLLDGLQIYYGYVDHMVSILFYRTPNGIMWRHIVALLLSPILITGITAICYRVYKKKPMPYFMQSTWLVWILIVFSSILLR